MTTFAPFTRRTNEPKLHWLELQLDQAGIRNRRNGKSFHAPILEVDEERLDEALEMLYDVDDVADDDPRWDKEIEEYYKEATPYEFWV